jgi:hypothetical protein
MEVYLIIAAQLAILVIWIRAGLHTRALKSLPGAEQLALSGRGTWPRLSILIPALNEGKTIGPALRSLLAVDYPDLEVVCVNDRSTDDTGAVLAAVAAGDPRVKAINVTELPHGWLGKVHALDRALEFATGDFILCTDADIHFSRDALKRAVQMMEHRDLDHLALTPDIKPAGLVFDVALVQAMWTLFFDIDPAKMGTDNCRAPMGVGAFNLVRGEFMRNIQPFKRLRMEVIDDIGLAIMCHQAGGRGALMSSGPSVSLEYYDSFMSLLRGMEKNAFAILHYSVLRALGGASLASLLPVFAFGLPICSEAWTRVTACALFVFAILWQYVSMRNLGVRLRHVALMPLGLVLAALIGFNSMLQTMRRGGVVWRGTFYPLAELRRMQVTRFPVPPRISSRQGKTREPYHEG